MYRKGWALRKKSLRNLLFFAIIATVLLALLFFSLRRNYTQNIRPKRKSSCGETESTGDFTINLVSRQFLPLPEIDSGLSWLKEYPGERAHVLLQLCVPLDKNTKDLFERSGIYLLGYVSNNTWFASVPKDLGQKGTVLAKIRWFGPVLPKDKLSSSVVANQLPSWAIEENGLVTLQVSFFEDIDLERARQVISEPGGKVISSTKLSNKLTVSIPKESIPLLAKEDSVRWIDVIPPPPVINEE